MAYIEVHQGLRDHPKTARLRRRLGVSLPAAVGHLQLLWGWAIDYAPYGDLSRFDADVIADAACWEDDPGVFVRALIGAGFLNDDMTIHDWEDYAGRLIDRREANAKRMRTARQQRRAELLAEVVSGARVADGTPHNSRTTAGRGGLPDLTVPDLNHTGPEPTTPTPQPPSPQAGPGERPNRGNPRRRKARENAQPSFPTPEVPADLVPATPGDLALWHVALDALTKDWLPANREKVEALELLGRDDRGALWLRAPPWAYMAGAHHQVGVALVNAGDQAGGNVVITEG